MYKLNFGNHFKRKVLKFTDSVTKSKLGKALRQLEVDPFYKSLKTHKADIKYGVKVNSSWVIGDLRIAWRFSKNPQVIDIIDIGNHKIYK